MSSSPARLDELIAQLPDRSLRNCWTGVEGDILRATFESILERGIGATSTYEIATRAGTYQGRLRHYFPERELIFKRLLELMYGTHERQLDDIACSPYVPETKLALILESGLRWVTETTDEFLVYVAYWSHAVAVGGELLDRCRELTEHFESTMAAIIAEGRGDAAPDEGTMALAQELLGLIWGLGLRYAMDPDPARIPWMRRSLRSAAGIAHGLS